MRRAITSLLAVGIGAYVVSMMRDRNNRRNMMNMMEPLKNMNMSKMIPKQMTKRMMRPLA